MRREETDFFTVHTHHLPIHYRLMNWSRYVEPDAMKARWGTQPMFRGYRSSEVWASECKVPVDELDGQHLEQVVFGLPTKNRDTIRWHYCFWRIHPGKVCRYLAVTKGGLVDLLNDGRSMVNNRAQKKA